MPYAVKMAKAKAIFFPQYFHSEGELYLHPYLAACIRPYIRDPINSFGMTGCIASFCFAIGFCLGTLSQ
jgi:hypothetical protein